MKTTQKGSPGIPISVFLFLIILMACRASVEQPGHREIEQTGTPNHSKSRDTIVFVTIDLAFDSVSMQSKLTNVQVVKKPGYMKPSRKIEFPGYSLKWVLYGRNGASEDSFTTEHPLHRMVEYTDEHGHFVTKEFHLASETIFTRFSKKDYGSLQLFENTPSRSAILLKRIQF